MKSILIFLVPVFFILLSCTKTESPETVSQIALESVSEEMIQAILMKEYQSPNAHSTHHSATKNAVTKPLKIKASGTMFAVPEVPECGGLFKVLIEGQGNATHLGLFTIELSYCSDGVNPTGPIQGVQTAANGDELYTVVVGANPEVGSLDFYYYDGTGRFEGATGFITLFFKFDYQNNTWENYGEGTITY